MCWMTAAGVANAIEISPLITSVSAAAIARYGMCCTSMPAYELSISPIRCGSVPLPAEPNW